ncbi:MAG: hypothetical protein K6E57_02050 [Fibrobacter sp.]|nr:hypothetical protein [Fibrobacter sp.]
MKFPSLPIINKELISGLNPGKYILNVEYNTKNISVYTFSIATDSSDAAIPAISRMSGATFQVVKTGSNQFSIVLDYESKATTYAVLDIQGHGFYVIKVEQNLKMVNFR